MALCGLSVESLEHKFTVLLVVTDYGQDCEALSCQSCL